jgi:hypothetical protein
MPVQPPRCLLRHFLRILTGPMRVQVGFCRSLSLKVDVGELSIFGDIRPQANHKASRQERPPVGGAEMRLHEKVGKRDTAVLTVANGLYDRNKMDKVCIHSPKLLAPHPDLR